MQHETPWRILPPRTVTGRGREFIPDAHQRAVIELEPGHGPVLVLGAPGTGRSSTVVEFVVHRLAAGADPQSLLVLAPSRTQAAELRDAISERAAATISTPLVRAWQAYAFDLLRRAHGKGLLPGVVEAPVLLSGPEQDAFIADMMRGHTAGHGTGMVWPPDLDRALQTRGFRGQLRELFDRMNEYRMPPEQLARWAEPLGHPEWRTAAAFRAEYQQVRALRMPNAFDPSALVDRAARVLEENPEFLEEERARLAVVLVDDLQEATPSVHRMIGVLTRGADAIYTANPDTTVQGFRGARPDLLRTLGDRVGTDRYPLQRRSLELTHRLPAKINQSWQRVSRAISVVAGARTNRAPESPGEDPGSVRAVVFDSPTAQARWCADHFLRLHVLGGVPYREMAVIVRSGAQLSELTRQLASLGVPTTSSAAETPLREEPAVIPLLNALRLLLDAEQAGVEVDTDEPQGTAAGDERPRLLTAEAAVSLLTSRLGGASPMDVRRIRQRLRVHELSSGGGRTSDTLLVEALTHGVLLEAAGVRSGPAHRIADMLQAGQEALAVPGATAESVLWALWDASGVAEPWRRRAISGGADSVRADRDLDAVVGLFESAERFVDQVPGATAQAFMDYMEHQELPMDTLAARAPAEDNVSILTPAGSAGQEWEHVVVAGVQQGVWPNTTLRGQLLGTDVLTDALDFGVEQAARIGPLDRLRQVRFDELRQFATAVSRASSSLVVSAVSNQDEQPSELLDLVASGWGGEDSGIELEHLAAPVPLTLRQLTGSLRRTVFAADEAPELGEAAARLLHEFTSLSEPVRGADPNEWWGWAPLSSDGPLFAPHEPIPVSPSKIETIHRSPLDWFVSEAKAEEVTDFSRSLGTLVHDIAETMPDSPSTELIAELRRRWPSLGMPPGWVTDAELERAEAMLGKFAEYVINARKDDGRELVGVEGSFHVLVRGAARDALLRGRVDRLEVDSHGHHVVVDLKTGKSQPVGKKIENHPQLGAYQVALQAGAGEQMRREVELREKAAAVGEDPEAAVRQAASEPIELPRGTVIAQPGGALLVQLGTSAKKVGTQHQPPLDPDHVWARDLITRAAELVAGTRFEARHDSEHGSSFGLRCTLPWVCPLCAEGRQVSEQ